MQDDEKLKKIVNSSGFPLQISVAHKVKETEGEHGWHVLSNEHAWKDKSSGESGFIDLIFENRDKEYLLAVECKRVQDSSWIFLQPSETVNKRRHIKAWVSYKRHDYQEKLNWHDHPGEPSSVESEFCIVPGQDSKAKPMLERIAAELVSAAESFGLEDNSYYSGLQDYLRIVVPVVVTTAELKICNFSPESISLSNGEIDDAQFKTVPYLRFRKQLSTRRVGGFSKKKVNYSDISYAKENTVFILNSNHLIDFLKEFDIDE